MAADIVKSGQKQMCSSSRSQSGFLCPRPVTPSQEISSSHKDSEKQGTCISIKQLQQDIQFCFRCWVGVLFSNWNDRNCLDNRRNSFTVISAQATGLSYLSHNTTLRSSYELPVPPILFTPSLYFCFSICPEESNKGSCRNL